MPHGGVKLSALLKKGGIWRDGGKWGCSLCSGATISKGSGVRVPEARLDGAVHEERRGGEALSVRKEPQGWGASEKTVSPSFNLKA